MTSYLGCMPLAVSCLGFNHKKKVRRSTTTLCTKKHGFEVGSQPDECCCFYHYETMSITVMLINNNHSCINLMMNMNIEATLIFVSDATTLSLKMSAVLQGPTVAESSWFPRWTYIDCGQSDMKANLSLELPGALMKGLRTLTYTYIVFVQTNKNNK